MAWHSANNLPITYAPKPLSTEAAIAASVSQFLADWNTNYPKLGNKFMAWKRGEFVSAGHAGMCPVCGKGRQDLVIHKDHPGQWCIPCLSKVKTDHHVTDKGKLVKPALLMLPAGNVPKPMLLLPAGAIALPVPEDAPLVNAVISLADRVIWKQAREQGQKLTALYEKRYRWQTGEVSPRKVAKAA
jgi:hypothetical protein